MTPRAIVTDIEGTTSSLAFVQLVLFPYARARLADYVASHRDAVAGILDVVRAEAGETDLTDAACVALLASWHDADRKFGPLKDLQGLIWAQGYADGTLTGHVYPDAVAGLRRWHARGITLAVYSSGSIAAQQLLFSHTDFGDLTPVFSAYFDTAIGAKQAIAAYQAIASTLTLPPHDILFLSDVAEELAAAHAAGFHTTLLARDGLPAATSYAVATSFDTILPA